MPQRMTKQTTRLLEVLLSDPGRRWYGLELMDRAELRSGTTYPLLHRLQEEGWLSSARERIDPSQEGRPRRRLYQLTGLGQAAAREAIERRSQPATAAVGSAPLLRPREATL
jgi:PadR family transcriptional regulator, regulatory protein PadR